jgi:hypothetical protein
MTAALTKPKSGFGVSKQTPQQIIRSMCQKEVLRPQNIDAFVLNNRSEMDRDYPYRIHTFTEHPLECYEEEPSSHVGGSYRHHSAGMSVSAKYMGQHGFLTLSVVEYPDMGYTDFSVDAEIGGRAVFHKLQAKNNIIRVYGEEVYKEWRRHVLDTYDESIAWLMNDISEKCPGLKAYSITTCESAERLMARTPNVYLHRKMAFLIVPEK